MPAWGRKETVRLTAQLPNQGGRAGRPPGGDRNQRRGKAQGELKVAVTLVAAVMVVTHVPVPVQPPPLQPANDEPPLGVAVSVTIVP